MILIRSFHPLIRMLAVTLAATPALMLGLGLALTPASAFAADKEESEDKNSIHPYIEYMAGVSIVPNQTLKGDGAAGAGLQGRAKPDPPGYMFGGAVGARFLEHFRGELQIGFRSTEVEEMAVQPGLKDAKGDLSLFSVMANGYFDLDLDLPVIPFVGVGIGWGMPGLDVQNQPGATQLSIDDTDSVFVWNAMVGGTFPISEVAELTFGYRYIQTEDIKYRSTIGVTPQRMEFEFDAHETYLGLRFVF